jgi:hypothetical protein
MIFVIRTSDAVRSKQGPVSDLDADHHELAVLESHPRVSSRRDGKLCIAPMTDLEDALGNDGSQEGIARVILSTSGILPKREASESHIGHILIICRYNSTSYSPAWMHSHRWVNVVTPG